MCAGQTLTSCFLSVVGEREGTLSDGELIYNLNCVRISEITKERRTIEFLLQRFNIAIQRGNATSVVGALDSSSVAQNLDEVPYV